MSTTPTHAAAETWKVTIYRRDSQTKVVYENVKHAWWDGDLYKVAQYSTPPKHHYWTWPVTLISHVKEERE